MSSRGENTVDRAASNIASLWRDVLDDIELQVSKGNFSTWFSHAQLDNLSDDQATISVPNIFVKQHLEKRFATQIRDSLQRHGVQPTTITCIVRSTKNARANPISREVSADDLVTMSRQSTAPAQQQTTLPTVNSLNPRYTLDSFVVGSCNDLAYTACLAASENLGTKYNPLFIYGGVGLGKTHLIQAVGNKIIQTDPGKRVLYTSSDMFVKDFLHHIRYKKGGFSEKYNSVDMLIIDDMQFIAGKEKTQEEFFHTFNTLHQANKQIIISSDRPPQNIPTLAERLKSRLSWGMTIDIGMPDFETRCAIIETKASQSGVELDRAVVEYIASNVKTNTRELEGILNQLLAHAEVRNIPADINLAQDILGDIKTIRPQHVTAKQIVEKTAKYFDITARDITSARRDKFIAEPRQIAMYLLRNELHMSFPAIARELGKKDHTTAIHSVEKITRQAKLDATIQGHLATLREVLYG